MSECKLCGAPPYSEIKWWFVGAFFFGMSLGAILGAIAHRGMP